jgi:hypothetical protein
MRNPSPLFELLDCISKYYPVSLPFDREQYPGFIRLRKIFADKIDNLIAENPSPGWTSLVILPFDGFSILK